LLSRLRATTCARIFLATLGSALTYPLAPPIRKVNLTRVVPLVASLRIMNQLQALLAAEGGYVRPLSACGGVRRMPRVFTFIRGEKPLPARQENSCFRAVCLSLTPLSQQRPRRPKSVPIGAARYGTKKSRPRSAHGPLRECALRLTGCHRALGIAPPPRNMVRPWR